MEEILSELKKEYAKLDNKKHIQSIIDDILNYTLNPFRYTFTTMFLMIIIILVVQLINCFISFSNYRKIKELIINIKEN